MRTHKLFLLLVAMILAFSLTACETDSGGQGGRSGDGSGNKDTQTSGEDTAGGTDVVDGDTTTTHDTGTPPNDTGETCAPACDGKQCGPDGCDGTCGACGDGATCDAAGQCVADGCDCAGKACGDDGCGGACGECGAGTTCEANQCVPVATGTCTQSGFNKVGENVQHDPNQSYVVYSAVNSDQAPQDAILIESYQSAPYNGPTGPGTFTLTGENYADCGLCVRMSTGCTESGCAKQLLAKSGTVNITELDTNGGNFTVTLTDVQFEEVTIDPNTWVSTPVEPGGELWCVPSFDGQAAFPGGGSGELKDECVAGGTGIMLNNNIADFELENCNGKKMSLHHKCGDLKVMWLIASAGWCPSCAEYLPMVADYVNQLQGQGQPIDMWVVLGEDNYGNPVTQNYCTNYAQQHNLDPNKVFMDYQYAVFFDNVWPYPASDGSFGVPWDALLDGDNMGFSWHSGTGGDIEQAVQGLLAD